MKTENIVLMRMARESLQGKWGLAIGTFIVYSLCTSGILLSGSADPANMGLRASLNITVMILGGPLYLGAIGFALAIARGEDAQFSQLFDGFKFFGKALATYLRVVFTILLWALLLVIPGIIASLSYSMTFFILADDKSLSPKEAMAHSKQMMNGYKGKLFLLLLRFLLLAFACILTLGIGFFWLLPYYYVTLAKFYDDLKTPQPSPFSFEV